MRQNLTYKHRRHYEYVLRWLAFSWSGDGCNPSDSLLEVANHMYWLDGKIS